jgi:hypothetical protein
MTTHEVTASDTFARIGAYVGHLFEDVSDDRPIELHHFELSQPATRGLNRPYDISDLMSRAIAP